MSASLLGQLLVSGVSSSFILLLTSLGLVIIMGYMKVVNLAHTEMLIGGSLYQLLLLCRAAASFVVTAAARHHTISFLFGALVERTIISAFLRENGGDAAGHLRDFHYSETAGVDSGRPVL